MQPTGSPTIRKATKDLKPEHFGSCIYCGALVLVAAVRLHYRDTTVIWNPDMYELLKMSQIIGDDCLHRQGYSSDVCQFHDCRGTGRRRRHGGG